MIDHQLAQFIGIMRDIDCAYEGYAKSVGLTYMSLSVLGALHRASAPLTQRELCEQCRFGKQSIGSIVAGFRGRGYLELEGDAVDRRSKRVVFTEAGRAYAESVMAPLREIEREALSSLEDGEREHMLRMMERCRDGFARSFAEGGHDESAPTR